MQRTKRFLPVLLLALLAPISGPADAGDPGQPALKMGFPVPADSYPGLLLSKIYREAFARLDVDIELQPCPVMRCTRDLEAGRIDGELARGRCYGDWHRQLVRVEESPLPALQLVAYVTNPELTLPRLQEMDSPELMVGYWRGAPEIERFVSRAFPLAARVLVNDTEQGLHMLVAGRFDVLAGVSLIADALLTTPEFSGKPLHAVGVIGARTVHAFLASEHAGLSPALSDVLRAVKREGLVAVFEREARSEAAPLAAGLADRSEADSRALLALTQCESETVR